MIHAFVTSLDFCFSLLRPSLLADLRPPSPVFLTGDHLGNLFPGASPLCLVFAGFFFWFPSGTPDFFVFFFLPAISSLLCFFCDSEVFLVSDCCSFFFFFSWHRLFFFFRQSFFFLPICVLVQSPCFKRGISLVFGR